MVFPGTPVRKNGQTRQNVDILAPAISPRGDRMRSEFGWIEIGGTRYGHDVVIHTDGTVTKRKKTLSKPYASEFGHTPLSAEELAFLEVETPEFVYIGTGQYGDLPVTPRAAAIIAHYPHLVRPLPDILPMLEKERRKYAAILHITC
jgi:hypothetical protein